MVEKDSNLKSEINRKEDVDIIERIGNKEDLAKLYSKLAKTTSEIRNVKKNGENKFHNYKYAKADDIYEVVSQILSGKYNIWLCTMPIKKQLKTIKTKKGYIKEIYLEKYFAFNDGDTGACVGLIYHGYDADKTNKFLYKAYTGALKYFLRDNFMIDTGDPDPEMDNAVADQPGKFKVVEDTTDKSSDKSLNNSSDKKANLNKIREYWSKNPEVVEKVAKSQGIDDISELSNYNNGALFPIIERIENEIKK